MFVLLAYARRVQACEITTWRTLAAHKTVRDEGQMSGWSSSGISAKRWSSQRVRLWGELISVPRDAPSHDGRWRSALYEQVVLACNLETVLH